ncbi:MAG: hypothetical protein ACE5LU_25995, partial [Anaerolineae bacterium]
FPMLDQLPAGLRAILEKALTTNVDDRLTATEFRQQLEAFRAAHAGSVRPLQFPQGDQVTTLTGLLDLWNEVLALRPGYSVRWESGELAAHAQPAPRATEASGSDPTPGLRHGAGAGRRQHQTDPVGGEHRLRRSAWDCESVGGVAEAGIDLPEHLLADEKHAH